MGYPLDQVRIDEALEYLSRRTRDDVFGQSDNQRAYAHYTLARAGRFDTARIALQLKSIRNDARGVEAETALFLRAALYLAGDTSQRGPLLSLLKSSLDGTKKTRAPAFFYSDVRTIGLRLAILAHLFPRDVSLKPYYDLLAQKLSGPSERYTTQELAWGLRRMVRPGMIRPKTHQRHRCGRTRRKSLPMLLPTAAFWVGRCPSTQRLLPDR